MEYEIQVENLVKIYGEGDTGVEALKDIDLGVRKGEVFAIMGPSGSGKTTLLMIIGLVTKPTNGRVVLDGQEIYNDKNVDLQRLRREKIGFIFQFSNLIPFLTARENVLIPLDLIGIKGGKAKRRAMELLDYLGMAERADHLPEQLSGGEKQRVAIARALANNPKVILADEPTASLDTERALSVMHMLKTVAKEQGTAILIVTHDERMTGEVDGLIKLLDGRIADRKMNLRGGPTTDV